MALPGFEECAQKICQYEDAKANAGESSDASRLKDERRKQLRALKDAVGPALRYGITHGFRDFKELEKRLQAVINACRALQKREIDLSNDRVQCGQLIRTVNDALSSLRNIWLAISPSNEVAVKPEGKPDATSPEIKPTTTTNEVAAIRLLLGVFTNGLTDARFDEAARVLENKNLSADEKLTKIDNLMPFPPTASAAKLGKLVGTSKQAVMKGDWWDQHRKGEKNSLIGRREKKHVERAKQYEQDGTKDAGK